jgi:Skp family chaperone for outer membrane proteins
MVNKAKVVPQTKEQIEYEDAKKNFRIATAKARLHSGGIDPSRISQQVIDKVMRVFDDMDHVQQDNQQKITKAQQDTEAKIQKLNQDANQKFAEIQKRYQDLVNSLQNVTVSISQEGAQVQDGVQPTVQDGTGVTAEIQAEPAKEEVREKTQEEKVAEIAEILLQSMKGQILEKVNDIMCILDKKASDVVTRGQDGEQASVPKEEPVEPVPVEKVEEVEKVVPTEEPTESAPEKEIKDAVYKDIA